MTTRIAAAALNQTALDLRGNALRIRQALEQGKQAGATIICLPELCLTGYGSEDLFLSPGFTDQALRELSQLIPWTRGIVTGVGLPVRFEDSVYNGVAMLVDGEIIGIVPKQNLARDGLHYEPRWFRPWTPGRVAETVVDGKPCPLGDLVFQIDDWRMGLEICEDAWVKDRPLERLVERGVNLILNPSASHFAFGKNEIRQRLIRDAVENHPLVYVYANLLGNEAGRAIYDGDTYIGADGRIVVQGRRFSFADHELLYCDVSPAEVAAGESTGLIQAGGRRTARDSGKLPSVAESGWEQTPHRKEEEFTRAVSLGLFDYVRKSRSRGVVISLSGGADSAAVACLSRLMLELALTELGKDRFLDRFSYFPELATGVGMADWARELICTAYQATRNSTETTRLAARDVALGIGSTHYELDLEGIVADYRRLVATSIGRELDWERDDIALQNIQARSRAPGIWMFANIRHALLLSTSNRSEAAVGYATMDGDTSGGLAPIAGIDKAFLRHWLVWLETTGPWGLAPCPFLRSVNRQQPTAELRPPESGQTDEVDLMPYPVLDFIERCAIRDRLMPKQILPRLLERFEEVPRDQAIAWIQRFFRLWCRNQWKRERYAPSFHLDDESLDPKTWCRFPILSGGFEQELAELDGEG